MKCQQRDGWFVFDSFFYGDIGATPLEMPMRFYIHENACGALLAFFDKMGSLPSGIRYGKNYVMKKHRIVEGRTVIRRYMFRFIAGDCRTFRFGWILDEEDEVDTLTYIKHPSFVSDSF